MSAIEGYLSRAATAMNEPHALTALRLISDHLVQAVDAPGGQEEVTALATAGVHAAVASSNTLQSTTAALSGLLAAFLAPTASLSVPRTTSTCDPTMRRRRSSTPRTSSALPSDTDRTPPARTRFPFASEQLAHGESCTHLESQR